MGLRPRLLGGIAAGLIVAAACTSFSSNEDASDAGADAGGSDALAPPPPSGDGSADAADAGRFCPQPDAFFCDDFDEPGADIRYGWADGLVTYGIGGLGGDASLTTDDFLSPPHGAIFHSNVAASTQASGLELRNANFHLLPFACELDFKTLTRSTASDGTDLVTLAFNAGGAAIIVFFAEAAPGTFSLDLYDGGNYAPGAPMLAGGLDAWHHLRLAINGTKVTATVDGISQTVTVTPTPGGAIELAMGAIEGRGPSSGWTVAFDNVFCRAP
jgi:hypothetical protein